MSAMEAKDYGIIDNIVYPRDKTKELQVAK
jgi:ATP-dependent protease ClpP protease subunit